MFYNISNIGPHRSKQIRSFHMTDSLAFSQFYGFHWVARDFKLLTELVRSFISFKCMKQNLFLPAFLWQADKNQVQYKTDEKMQQTKNWEKRRKLLVFLNVCPERLLEIGEKLFEIRLFKICYPPWTVCICEKVPYAKVSH